MTLFSYFQAPANTDAYFIAGYAVFFTVMALYLTVLVTRNRNLQQEYELLLELSEEE